MMERQIGKNQRIMISEKMYSNAEFVKGWSPLKGAMNWLQKRKKTNYVKAKSSKYNLVLTFALAGLLRWNESDRSMKDR